MGKYYCGICNKQSMQKSHHEAHLKSESHKDKRKLRYFEIKETIKESGKGVSEEVIENLLKKEEN